MGRRSRKKQCSVEGCIYGSPGHEGLCALKCETCRGDGIVAARGRWVRCLTCRGRGWIDQKPKAT